MVITKNHLGVFSRLFMLYSAFLNRCGIFLSGTTRGSHRASRTGVASAAVLDIGGCYLRKSFPLGSLENSIPRSSL